MNIGTRQQRRPERAAYDFFSWTFWNSGLRAQHDFAQAVNDYIEKRLRGEYGRLSRRPFLDLPQNGLLESIYAGLCSRTTCLRPLRLWPRTSVTPGPLRMEAAMKISADADMNFFQPAAAKVGAPPRWKYLGTGLFRSPPQGPQGRTSTKARTFSPRKTQQRSPLLPPPEPVH